MEPSFMQIQAKLSRFDGGNDYREDKAAAVYDPRAMEAPGRRVRKPSAGSAGGAPAAAAPAHPQADWAGMVPKQSRRKQAAPTVAQALGTGFETVEPEAAPAGKKHYAKDVRFASVDKDAEDAPLGSAAYQLGPGGQHSAAEWKSESHALMEQERAAKRGTGKRSVGPNMAMRAESEQVARSAVAAARAAERTGGAAAAYGAGTQAYASAATAAPTHSSATRRVSNSRSMSGPNSLLSGIGAKLMQESNLVRQGAAPAPAAAPAATRAIPGYQGHKPAAPVAAAAAPAAADPAVRSQYLLHGNYTAQVPGYTGHVPKNPAATRFA